MTDVEGESTTLLDGLAYRADGLVTAQSFGNGLDETRAYDQQGRLISQFLGGADTRVYAYDANGNLTAKHTVPEVASYSYDSLDRLNAETLTNTSIESIDYSYDPNANRLGANEERYTYAPASNRLTAINTSAVTLDAAGNTLSDAEGRSFTYNAAGRLAQVAKDGATAGTYVYNFQGQRTRKVSAEGTTVYHYDLAGNLIAETDSSAQTINQYLWANGAPIAASLGASDPGVFTFSGTDSTTGKSVSVRVDTNTEHLAVHESGGFSGDVHPDHWAHDETTQTLNVFHRAGERTRLAATFALAATPPTGRLSIATTPRRARYRFPNQTGEPLTGSDPATGESATLSLDPSARTVMLNEHGTTRTLAIAPEDWTSIGFGRLRLSVFRFDEAALSLFGLVLERHGRAQGFLALRAGIARQANYDLTGQAERTAELVYVHTDHLSTPRLATDADQTVIWHWAGLAFGNTAPTEDPDGDGVKTTFNLRFPGQYHDGESGLHYNWNRYYDPKTGRYVTSDPIGVTANLASVAAISDSSTDASQSSPRRPMSNALLIQGLNHPYAHVGNNPLRWIDPLGLKRVTTAEQVGGVWMFWYSGLFRPDCGNTPGGCGDFHKRFRITWTAEASGSCVFAGFATQIFNGPKQWFLTHFQWWQVTHTEWKYKSNDDCPCAFTDYRIETEETPFPHPGTETLQ
jgi:RHS repeat-associated protein